MLSVAQGWQGHRLQTRSLTSTAVAEKKVFIKEIEVLYLFPATVQT